MKITFYCGNSIEEWSSKSEDSGIGGSEEAVINMARCLQGLGNEVTVYNRCGDDEGTYDGVTYENYEYFTEEHECDILIYWRVPQYVEKYRRAKAKKVFLWLHDCVAEHEILPSKFFLDGIFVLSNYHASLLPHLKELIIKTQNGVNIKAFDQKVKRNPKKIVYGSSYDRGLKELLEMWPEIRLADPEAELSVFYGLQGLEKAGFSDFIDEIKHLLDQEGVTDLGRISHDEVAREFLSAGIWVYPCWFPEISCITAMKAQIAGAIPVVTPTAALVETVRWGLTTREPRDEMGQMPWGTEMPDYLRDYFVKLVLKALDPNFQGSCRDQMMLDTKRTFDWRVVAGSWNQLFKEAK